MWIWCHNHEGDIEVVESYGIAKEEFLKWVQNIENSKDIPKKRSKVEDSEGRWSWQKDYKCLLLVYFKKKKWKRRQKEQQHSTIQALERNFLGSDPIYTIMESWTCDLIHPKVFTLSCKMREMIKRVVLKIRKYVLST
jgi:hypothetical protein